MRAAKSYQVSFPPPSDDGQQLPDLQVWIKLYGGYYNIPPAAWARWDSTKPIASIGVLI